MRQSLAKGVRRDIRRALGPDVLDVVTAQTETIDKHSHTIHQLVAAINLAHEEIRALKARVVALEQPA